MQSMTMSCNFVKILFYFIFHAKSFLKYLCDQFHSLF